MFRRLDRLLLSREQHYGSPTPCAGKQSPFKNSFKETVNRPERLSIFALRKRHFRGKRNLTSPRRESRARRIPAIVMESLLELQNEGNGLGLRIPGRLEELYGDRGGRFSLLGSRPLVSSLDPISSDPGVFSGFPECQAMNIRVLV